MNNPLIIKGGIYTNGDMLLKPHYSGYFFMVDCTEYKTKKYIKADYDKKTAKQILAEEPLIYEGVKYWECEYRPHGTEKMELLSDVSDLEIINDEYDF